MRYADSYIVCFIKIDIENVYVNDNCLKVDKCTFTVYYFFATKGDEVKLQLMRLRKAAGYRNRDTFAEAIGVKPRTYKTWESGESRMNFEQACMVADFLGVSLDELAGRTEYVGTFSDERQRRLNEDFAALDDASRDAAVAAVRGMAVACARGDDPAGSEADILSA